MILLKKKKIDFYLVKMKLQYMLFFKKKHEEKKELFLFLSFYKAKNDLTKGSQQEGCTFCLSQTKKRRKSKNQHKLISRKNNMKKMFCFFSSHLFYA